MSKLKQLAYKELTQMTYIKIRITIDISKVINGFDLLLKVALTRCLIVINFLKAPYIQYRY